MTKFFEALEQAERERALRAQAHAPAGINAPPAASAPAPSVALPELALTPNAVVTETLGLLDEHLVSFLKPTSSAAEQYRTLRHIVERAHVDSGLQVLGVSSPGPRDGKTLTALNLAGALAQAVGTRVLVIDMDLRHTVVASHLALDDVGVGLAEAILNPEVTLDQVVQRCPAFNLYAVPARRSLDATYELLASKRCQELIETARQRYDYVVVDLPPLIPIPDCHIVQKWVDGFVVVVAANQTPRKLLAAALDALSPDKVVGLVFNGADGALAGYAYAVNGQEAQGRRWFRRFARTRARSPVRD